ncbi:uncharacterized protein Z518_03767 [Rhinocladiella mackenziei CBS 650.93]|uniref:Very-long-chain 3-oxoacyl-CoA reductase n=1 Tax=Rhinocladiella mackenziei CBS 650.93 TaxID=1442369 RepID=A0A0D2J9K3_9EURO|nr:uncharacterized protein Z518_03767 [Rhinocladiella mackenziei CBS 650.93]KIX05795.1 hypothetical protein Z518_03767 [Rhinocladiella mackenziei CBS 650.93]
MATSTRIYPVSSLVGFLTLSWFLYKAVELVRFLLHSSKLSRYQHTTSGGKSWALVTGASDGIGKGFAQELCSRGFNVVLHGRNEKKLAGVKDELEKEFKCEIRLLVLDAAADWNPTSESTVLAVLKDLTLTVVVNNVGGSGGIRPDWAALTEISAADLDTWINLNTRFMSQITRLVLPLLAQNQPALILNVSSASEQVPTPYLVAYAAAKAYVSRWCVSLNCEMVAENLDVEIKSLDLGMVVTAGAERDDSMLSLFMPSARTVAKTSLDKVGCGHVVVTPYWPHILQFGVLSALPDWILQKMVIKITKDEMVRMRKTGVGK